MVCKEESEQLKWNSVLKESDIEEGKKMMLEMCRQILTGSREGLGGKNMH